MRYGLRLALFATLFLRPVCQAEAARVMAVSFDSVIHPITVEILGRAIAEARGANADILLIRLNTPGGLLDATRKIIQQIDSCPMPVVTFVTPSGGRAASAGFFILEAGDVAAMAYGTHAGAASPVMLGGEMDAVMRKKVENDAAAALRSQAAKRGRNTAAAEKAVLEAKSFSDQEALESKLIDLTVVDEAALLKQLDGRVVTRFDGSKQTIRLASPQVTEYRLTWRQAAMVKLSDPNIAFLILMLGVLGIYLEFSAPGMILPGVLGAISLLLGLSALSVLPINWMGAGLIVLGLAFFVLEAKITSHGILGAGGIVSLVLGALFLVEGPPEMRIRLGTALAVALPLGLITGFLVVLVVRARARKVETGALGMIGSTGVSVTDLSPGGKVFVHGEYWDAVSATPVGSGAEVKVIALDGLTLTVEPVEGRH